MADSVPQIEIDHLVDPRWAGVLALVLLASVIFQQAVVFFATIILLLALGLSWIWGRYCLARLEYSRTFSSPAVAFGEEVTLTVTVVNRKLLPLSWLEIDDETPRALEVVHGALIPTWKVQRALLQQILSLRWYERVIRRYRLRCSVRGEQTFGPVELRSGDLFGLARRRFTLPAYQTFLVYPKVVPLTALGLPSRFPLGEARTTDRLWRDPLRIAGIRPYLRGDSIRQIHWKATAHLGALQVRTEDPSAMLRVVLLLNVSTAPRPWEGFNPDLLELLICVAASVATHLEAQRAQVGLAVNALPSHNPGYIRVPASRSPRQLASMLAVLARIRPLAETTFATVLAGERHRLPVGATIVVITGLCDQTLLEQVQAYRSAGHPVTLLLVGDALREARAPGLAAYWIGEEARWRDLGEIRVAGAAW
jgi:uncharacterized protein (DUF58 family)